MRTSDLMQKDVLVVSPELSLEKLESFLTRSDISGAPVVGHDGKLLGVVSRTDLVRAMSDEQPGQSADPLGPNPTVEDIMTREVIFAEPGDDIRNVAKQMIDGHLHRVLVVEDGAIVGIVTALDLLGSFVGKAT